MNKKAPFGQVFLPKGVFFMDKYVKAMGYVIAILFSTLIIAAVPTEAEYDIYADTVRLHILAESDEECDQELKIKIRDLVLEKYGARLAESGSVDEATHIAISLENEIEDDVSGWIRDFGFDYSAECVIGEEWYDTRYYDGFALPSGEYISVRIVLGDGGGQNWWCVMYPPLCLDMSTEYKSGYTKAENDLIAGKYVVKFKILELLSAIN